MDKKGSVGITLLGIFLLLNSLINIAGLIFGIGFMGPIPLLPTLYLFGLPIIAIISAVGLLLFKNWARILIILIVMIKIIERLQGLILDKSPMAHDTVYYILLVQLAIAVLIGVLIVWHLTRPKVKEQFK